MPTNARMTKCCALSRLVGPLANKSLISPPNNPSVIAQADQNSEPGADGSVGSSPMAIIVASGIVTKPKLLRLARVLMAVVVDVAVVVTKLININQEGSTERLQSECVLYTR